MDKWFAIKALKIKKVCWKERKKEVVSSFRDMVAIVHSDIGTVIR